MLKTVTNSINASQIQTPITLPGDVTLSTGNLVIGTSGKGIDFSATPGTGTSELLNDYEEGTWDVVLTPSTSGTITPYTQFNQAQYTKVGRLVTVSAQIKVLSVSSPIGSYVQMSLPFVISSLPELSGRFGGAINFQTVATVFSGFDGNQVIDIEKNASTVIADDSIYFSFSYVTA